MEKNTVLKFLFAIALCISSFYQLLADDINPAMPGIYNETGVPSYREPSLTTGVGVVDPFNGSVMISDQDIILPSNGGLDIVVNRIYRSHTDFLGASLPSYYQGWNTMGVGWDMHFGRVWISGNGGIGAGGSATTCRQSSNISSGNPVLEHADGTRETLFNTFTQSSQDFDSAYITKSRWVGRCLLNRSGVQVTSPDGIKYIFDYIATPHYGGNGTAYNVTKIEHPNGTSLTINYLDLTKSSGAALVDTVVNSEGRTVKFKYSNLGTEPLADKTIITLDSVELVGASFQKWQYYYEDIDCNNGQISCFNSEFLGHRLLDRVRRPDGKYIEYKYHNFYENLATPGHLQLESVKTPAGLLVEYEYDGVNFPLKVGSPDTFNSRLINVVSKKHVKGTANKNGTWEYRYYPKKTPFQLENLDVSIVDGPNECIEYKYLMINASLNTIGGNRWKNGLLDSKRIGSSCSNSTLSGVKESIQYDWDKQKIGPQIYLKPVHPNGTASSVNPDIDIYAQIMTDMTITRDGTSYTTTYSNHDDYGNPKTVSESSSQGSRSTTYTYLNDVARWIVNKVKTENISGVRRGSATSTYATTNNYFSNGNLKSANVNGVQTDFTYHTFNTAVEKGLGEIKTITDPEGNITNYKLYEAAQAKREELPQSIVVTREIDSWGRLDHETDGKGDRTFYDYDNLSNIKKVTTAKTNDSDINFQYLYSSVSGLIKTETRGGLTKKKTYDGLGNLEKIVLSGSGVTSIQHEIGYDENGRVLFRKLPNSSKRINYKYDAIGRLERVTYPDGNYVSLTYFSGNRVDRRDERGNVTRYHYRSYGNPSDKMLIKIEEPLGVTTTIDRNKVGDILSVTQDGKVRRYYYDTRFYLDYEDHPEVGRIDYVRDNVGNITQRKVGNSPTTNFIYDGLNRIDYINYTSANTPDIDYLYYKDNSIQSVIKGNTRWDYVYDKNKNLDKETLVISPNLAYVLDYTYNSRDHLTSIKYPSDLLVSYNPDILGRAQTVGTYVNNVDYFANGQISRIDYTNGVSSTYTQDSNRLFPEKFVTSKGSTNIENVEYFYDQAGNIDYTRDYRDSSKNTDFSYDQLNRLKVANGPWGNGNHNYDRKGNLTSKYLGNFSLTYNNNSSTNRLDSISGSKAYSFQYDHYGNVSSNGHNTFTYDEASNLIAANGGGVNIEYDIDGNNLRAVEYKNNSIAKYSVYGSNGMRMYEEETFASLAKDFIYLNGQLIADRSECIDASFDGDNDGIPSCTEAAAGLNPADAADAQEDPDNDGLNNLQEYQAGTGYFKDDTDDDGMKDGYEVTYSLDPLNPDQFENPDNDGASNLSEHFHNTNPRNPDTDGDGMQDGYEIRWDLNPLANDASGDKDNDGLANLQEFNIGTWANNPDTDNDNMPDGYEVDNGLNPLVQDGSGDLDNDGLRNSLEFTINTMPNNPDTDSDGMQDGYEVDNGLNPLVNDASQDKDSDGLSNLVEHNAGSAANNSDTDGDGMPDGYEYSNPTDILVADADLDPDNDSLTNISEYQNGTNPIDADSDNDGMQDGYEVNNGLNPLVNDAAADKDADGLSNLAEYQAGTKANDPDTDDDGMPDLYEVNNTLNPLVNDAALDADNDGLTNLQEYQMETDPNDSDTDDDGQLDGEDDNPTFNPAILIPIYQLLLG